MTSTLRVPGRSTEPTVWRPGRALSAVFGVVAVALTVGVAELLAAIGDFFAVLHTTASPLNSLGEGFIDLTPTWLKEFATKTFGLHDKEVLKLGMVLTLAVAAALIGVLARRSLRWAVPVVAVLAAVTLIAIYTRTGSTAIDGLPFLLAAVVGVALLARAFRAGTAADSIATDNRPDTGSRPATSGGAEHISTGTGTGPGDVAVADRAEPVVGGGKRVRTGEDHPMLAALRRRGLGRRDFLRLGGWAAAGAVVSIAIARWIPNSAAVQASRASVGVPTAPALQPIPADADLDINGLSPFITPNANFYRIDTALTPPRLRAQDWSLRIHGQVDKEMSVNYAQLTARPQVERAVTLTCVSNEVGDSLVGNAKWIGARIDDLLKEAGPQSGADCVLCTSVDGFTSSTPLEALTDGRDALLAVAMNGEPLPIEHGFPVRMVVPGLYGYVSATKWVTDLEVTQFSKVSAYWTARGWSDHGPVKTSSRIDVPGSGAQFAVGHAVTIAGVAWAQHRGISKVEVRIDNGAWQPATLSDSFSKDTWRQWKLAWTATAGKHTVTVRATDGTGALQDPAVRDVLPDGATGYHSIALTVS